MVRTRFAPSPTGYMHIGNLRTALYAYLVAKHDKGSFILRIEDTDQGRQVEGSLEVIYSTLKIAGLDYDEGPGVGGIYGPYIQSERKNDYLEYALKLVEEEKAYYCFCTKERLETLKKEDVKEDVAIEYDRHCTKLSKEEIKEKLDTNTPYVIRQLIPEGTTTFHDDIYGDITVSNDTLDDQILIKSDGNPTYNFANVVDDHLMEITHVIRGSEYLSSAPKYNLLYEAFAWNVPIYMHLPLILNPNKEKLSKRKGDFSFEDLIKLGYLPNAILNYIALLGWSPGDTREFFTLQELIESFDSKAISKSPSVFDIEKLKWMNSEYIKKMSPNDFYNFAIKYLKEYVKREDIDLKYLATFLQTRISIPEDMKELVDFIDELPNYDIELFVHKKMKSTKELSLEVLEKILPEFEALNDFNEENINKIIKETISSMELKNGQVFQPIRIALCGKSNSPCGSTELAVLLGKEESIERIKIAIEKLK